ncbi:tetratricopeptide repeat protein 25 [Agrilus planipennis]|uniref:Tetratricopeptide repeat protein 25 n=1 Tax=Agrilus planipennis TaxID=224129 RepID=A0A7F5R747_AGRPL|nr:tetratricopeptide repeat protein 25 [Agrilus planipennis]
MVKKCKEAIAKCLGERAGRPLRDHFKIIRRLAWKKNHESEKPEYEIEYELKRKKKKRAQKRLKAKKQVVKEPVFPLKQKKRKVGKKESIYVEEIRDSLYTLKTESDFVPPLPKRFPYSPLQRYTSNIKNHMAERYLDKLYLDKIFLDNFKHNPGATCPNKAGSQKLLHLTREGFKTLHFNQEVLRARRPFYYIKYQEAVSSKALRARQMIELRKVQCLVKTQADYLLNKIKKYLFERETKLALDFIEKLKQFCEVKEKKVLPLREKYLLEMYELASQVYLDMKRITPGQTEADINRRILFTFGLPLSRVPSTDSVVEQIQQFHVDYKKEIAKTEIRLKKAVKSEEITWLYHELARFHSEVKQPELSKVYARKCVTESKKMEHLIWQINGMFLIVKVNMQCHNRNDAKNVLKETIEVSRELGNEGLTTYLEKSFDVIETADFEDVMGAKVIEKREKLISQLVAPAGLRDEAAFLFRQMSVMPASRRLSVMPGVRPEDTKQRKSASARKLSILPTPRDPDEEEIAPKSRSHKQADTQEDEKKGFAFLELVQYHID